MRYYLIFLIILYSCSYSKKNENSNAKPKDEIELSEASLSVLNKILTPHNIDDKKWDFVSAKTVVPNLHPLYYNKENIDNYTFIELNDKSENKLIIAINVKLCYAEILFPLDNFLYIDQGIIFPYDFSFINKDLGKDIVTCKNEDSLLFRELDYDKNIFGKWAIDSIQNPISSVFEIEKSKTISIIESFKVLNETKILFENDSLNFKQNGRWLNLSTDNHEEYFQRLIVGPSKMVWKYEDTNNKQMIIYFTKISLK